VPDEPKLRDGVENDKREITMVTRYLSYAACLPRRSFTEVGVLECGDASPLSPKARTRPRTP
jgi:hypothetical protein